MKLLITHIWLSAKRRLSEEALEHFQIVLITLNRNKMQCNQIRLSHLVIELYVSLKCFSKTFLVVNYNLKIDTPF